MGLVSSMEVRGRCILSLAFALTLKKFGACNSAYLGREEISFSKAATSLFRVLASTCSTSTRTFISASISEQAEEV